MDFTVLFVFLDGVLNFHKYVVYNNFYHIFLKVLLLFFLDKFYIFVCFYYSWFRFHSNLFIFSSIFWWLIIMVSSYLRRFGCGSPEKPTAIESAGKSFFSPVENARAIASSVFLNVCASSVFSPKSLAFPCNKLESAFS